MHLYCTSRRAYIPCQIHDKICELGYSPRTWRTQPLHLLPPEVYDANDVRTKATLDWIFLISALNFSFWSEYEDTNGRYAVEWKEGWEKGHQDQSKSWDGYWSLVAALNRGWCVATYIVH